METMKNQSNTTTLTVEVVENKIKKYIELFLFEHDMNIHRNDTNKKIYEKIFNKCMSDLENEELFKQFTNEYQIHYFVRQTILYLVLE